MSNTNKYQYDKANADHHAKPAFNRNKGTSELIREIAKAQEILISKKLTSINDRLLYLSNGVLW
jgi:hypothetical protein